MLTESADCYSSDVLAFWEDGQKQKVKKSFSQKKYDHLFEAAGPGCTYVMKSHVFMIIQGFITENYKVCSRVAFHDWLIYAFSRQAGFKWFIDDAPKILYRQHPANAMGANTNILGFLKRFQSIRRNWYREQVEKMIFLTKSESLININDRFFLIRNFAQLRRRPRDQLALLLFIVLGIF